MSGVKITKGIVIHFDELQS